MGCRPSVVTVGSGRQFQFMAPGMLPAEEVNENAGGQADAQEM